MHFARFMLMGLLATCSALQAKLIKFTNPKDSVPTKILENWIQPGESKTIEVTEPVMAHDVEYVFNNPPRRQATDRCPTLLLSSPPRNPYSDATKDETKYALRCKVTADELLKHNEIILY